ncbi:hypothetical protein BST81_20560 [Leptolyngbya sp. 'hensonii']|uniref:hypothetical protein n=1 Tax=Leptolyngbya sp. 'hensonii' TaxID=1922337 RepID=UPI00094FF276|nr:hypothetical protein [Leptolyngbya sp. 'hensonii']OLP16592.1 hypothetical protein BST81_20560 [Leptolyngbya sp. 'hensonii']
MSSFSLLKPRAVLLGLLVALGGAPIVGLLSRLVASLLFRWAGGSSEDFQSFFVSTLLLPIVALLFGLGLTVAGGITVAFLAPKAKLLNSTVLGLVTSALLLLSWGWMPDWYSLATLVLTLPCTVLGSWLMGTKQ